MAEGFLSRWSRRKAEVREGKAVEEADREAGAPAAVGGGTGAAGVRGTGASGLGGTGGISGGSGGTGVPVPPPQPSPSGGGSPGDGLPAAAGQSPSSLPPPLGEGGGGGTAVTRTPGHSAQPELPPPPTLDDVRLLTSDSDFSRFAARDVAPEVKNAAMKKLFADPRFNVMDRMDVYIDDYTKSEPVPESMLRQLAGAKFLGLFKDEESAGLAAPGDAGQAAPRDAAQAAPCDAAPAAPRDAAPAAPREVADDRPAQTVAQSDTAPEAVPEPPAHADPDLRLQQDDAPAGQEPGGVDR